MKKRFLAAVLVFTMMFSAAAQAGELTDLIKSKFGTITELVKTTVAKFKDVKASDWFANSMSKLVGIGVLNGYDGKLNPQGNVKADEFVKMTVTAMGHTGIENGSEYWAVNYIAKARELGLVKDGEFAQYNRAINREEIARIIIRASNETVAVDMDKVSKAFSDWGTVTYKDDLAKAVMLGIMSGYPDKTVRATASATRAEASTMIIRLIDPSERKVVDLSPVPEAQYVTVAGKQRKIRTTNLPKNHKDFPFILADVENAMYEAPTYLNQPWDKSPRVSFETSRWIQKEGNLEKWAKVVNDNLHLRLNVDYQNMPSDYAERLSKTYGDYGRIPTVTKDYVDLVKKNKIKVVAKEIRTEPTILYSQIGGYFIRSYVKFDVVGFEKNGDILIESECSHAKKGTYEGYIDTHVGTNMFGSDGTDLVVSVNYNNILKTVKFIK
jgi:hypothetical protein